MENLKENTPVLSAPQTFEGVKSLINYYKELGQGLLAKNPGLTECRFDVKGIPLDVFAEANEYCQTTANRKASYCYDSLAVFANKVSEVVTIVLFSERCKRSTDKISDYEPVLEEVAA